MTNVFQNIGNQWKDSSFVIAVFTAALILLGAGLIFLVEDTYSTVAGIEMLSQSFGMQPVTWPVVIWAMGITPEMVQILMSYLALSDTANARKWVAIGVFFFIFDLVSDVQYRSAGQFVDMQTGAIDFGPATIAAIAFGIAYFTIGSNVFISISIGVVLETIAPMLVQISKLRVNLATAQADAGDILNQGYEALTQRGQNQSQSRDRRRRRN